MIEALLIQPVFLFIFDSPQEWLLVIAAGFLLFGANRLPELAKSFGKTRKAFKDGMREADEEEAREDREKRERTLNPQPATLEIDDHALLAEIQRRKTLTEQPKAN